MKPVVLVAYPDAFAIEEAKSLVDSADRAIVGTFTQKYLNHSRYGIGSGKAEEIKAFVKESKAEQVVIDEHLTPRQIYNLEKLTGVQVIDRERLILDIFYSRATSTEAKLQIELAEIEYEMPRVRENAKLTSSGERAGKGGMGEYIVDVRFRDLKRRISFIKEKLKNAQRKRELCHQQRIKTGMTVVSLVGYTSSGKTTLFNLLTGEHKQTSSSLFTTLSTTTRSLKVNNEQEVLLTDTVGFISRLPTYMIDAFKSTLEESLAADLILLLIDASEGLQEIRIKYTACRHVLEELKADRSKVLVVFTKYDKLTNSEEVVKQIAADLGIPNPISISAKSGHGISKLGTMIGQHPRVLPVQASD
ncbi:GTPase HflX [Nitrososphaera viennensis]|nr:GTPase HflX [Nitrososphaera viennensis]UVS68160.1 GTPase HflX [Nitrososphaera viennensis]